MKVELEEYKWLRSKGYLHVTPQIDVQSKRSEILGKIKNEEYVAKYAFFPLLNLEVKERRYKAIPGIPGKRGHSYRKGNRIKKTAKIRPLHYATHMDALIFGYYAQILSEKYEQTLDKSLTESVIAYRSIKIDGTEKGKSTAHFAREVFEKIKERANPQCSVLKLDIKSFFNQMDHEQLEDAWKDLMRVKKLEPDHLNVFRAATQFSYINRDDLRVSRRKNGRRAGFDEKKLAEIRNKFGVQCFFESMKEFREIIKRGVIKLYKYPFKRKDILPNGDVKYTPVGIPQGLPISAVLANLYLLNFDRKVLGYVVDKLGGFYRRYSDDIVVICKPEESNDIQKFLMEEITESRVEISPDKTETFLFSKIPTTGGNYVRSSKIVDGVEKIGVPLTYLGFEFYGYKTLIKSANLAKFYRRMIFAVKKKSRRAIAATKKKPGISPVFFYRQLYKLYSSKSLKATRTYSRRKKLIPNEKGEFTLESKKIESKYKNNYFSYVKRVSGIMKQPEIKRQVRNHKRVFHLAVNKHFINKL